MTVQLLQTCRDCCADVVFCAMLPFLLSAEQPSPHYTYLAAANGHDASSCVAAATAHFVFFTLSDHGRHSKLRFHCVVIDSIITVSCRHSIIDSVPHLSLLHVDINLVAAVLPQTLIISSSLKICSMHRHHPLLSPDTDSLHVNINFDCCWSVADTAHFKENDCMRLAMEGILYEAGVDVVLNGHNHACERSNPVFVSCYLSCWSTSQHDPCFTLINCKCRPVALL